MKHWVVDEAFGRIQKDRQSRTKRRKKLNQAHSKGKTEALFDLLCARLTVSHPNMLRVRLVLRIYNPNTIDMNQTLRTRL